MEKYITDERTGLKYELVGDYYPIAGEDELSKSPSAYGGNGIATTYASISTPSIPVC